MMAINSRIAHAVKRVFAVVGGVISGPYHAHLLKTSQEVYRALAYVLMNVRKHWKQKHGKAPARVQIDEASSARWFEGFTRELKADRTGEREVGHARSWFLTTGWRKLGLINPAIIPGHS